MVVVKRKTSKCCLVMSLLRKMVFIALKQNILIKAEHIPGRQKLTLSEFETGKSRQNKITVQTTEREIQLCHFSSHLPPHLS